MDRPTVFISSTCEDLVLYREAAKESVIEAGCHPDMMEYFAASGNNPPVPNCIAKVNAADVLLVIIAHRYGWIPSQDNHERKSITWIECEAAHKKKEIL